MYNTKTLKHGNIFAQFEDDIFHLINIKRKEVLIIPLPIKERDVTKIKQINDNSVIVVVEDFLVLILNINSFQFETIINNCSLTNLTLSKSPFGISNEKIVPLLYIEITNEEMDSDIEYIGNNYYLDRNYPSKDFIWTYKQLKYLPLINHLIQFNHI